VTPSAHAYPGVAHVGGDGTGAEPRNWKKAGGTTTGALPPPQQHAPAAVLAQHEPVLDAYGPVLVTGHSHAPSKRLTTTARAPLGDVGRAYLRVLGEKTTWVVAAAFAGPLALYLVMNTWLPTHLQTVFAMTRPEAASWLSTMNLWGIPASLAIGVMLQRNIGAVRLHILLGAILLPLGVYGALSADAALRPVVFAIAGIGMFLPVAPLVTLLQRQPGMTAAKVGMVMGTMGSVTYVVSSVAPNVVGHFVAAGTAIDTLLVPCCLLGLTPVVALVLPEPRG